eukprot:g14869.t1
MSSLTVEKIEGLYLPKYTTCPLGMGETNSTARRALGFSSEQPGSSSEVDAESRRVSDAEYRRAVFLNLLELNVEAGNNAADDSVLNRADDLLPPLRDLAAAASGTATTTAAPDRCCCCPGFQAVASSYAAGSHRALLTGEAPDSTEDWRFTGEEKTIAGTVYRVQTKTRRSLAAGADGGSASPSAVTNKCECGSELRRHIAWTAPVHEYEVYMNDTFQDPLLPHMGYYHPKHKFPYMQSALLDTLIYQTRYKLMLCPKKAYSRKVSDPYAYNRDMDFTHGGFGLDAPKEVDLFDCVDRDHFETGNYDERIDTEGYNYGHGEDF